MFGDADDDDDAVAMTTMLMMTVEHDGDGVVVEHINVVGVVVEMRPTTYLRL